MGINRCYNFLIPFFFRDTFAPEIDPGVYPSAAFLKSVHNTVIEAFWRWLREKWGINMREHILRGKNEHIYVSEVPFHRCVLILYFRQTEILNIS